MRFYFFLLLLFIFIFEFGTKQESRDEQYTHCRYSEMTIFFYFMLLRISSSIVQDE